MKNKKILLLGGLVVLVIGTLLFTKLKSFGTHSVFTNETNYATLKIEGDQTYDISEFVGKTALEATESKAVVMANGTGENAFVTSISGRSADTKNREFWEFKVNGTQAQVGAGSYIIQNHDQIEWKITNY